MITIEKLNGEEVYAVDDVDGYWVCKECMFARTISCPDRPCNSAERPDGRNVIFRPIDDVRTTMAYAIQQGTPQ